MNEVERAAIFNAQTENVRELERAWQNINRQINSLILAKDEKGVEVNSKMLALLYCALAEATFSKLIHTPYCLPLLHVDVVKRAASECGIKQGWVTCAKLSVMRIGGAKTNHRSNVLKKLHELINDYIFDPSLIRNKLAHGQWAVALNRENTAVNKDITQEIQSLDLIELYRRKKSLEKLAAILEDIVESPNRAHHRDYWLHVVELEDWQKKMSNWTMQKKIDSLFKKKKRTSRRA